MIKRTLYFGNPTYLRTTNEQLVVEFPAEKGTPEIGRQPPHHAPIEDIGVVILDHPQITISQALMAKLLSNNVALITCDGTHHPTGLMLNLDGHTLQSRIFAAQLDASEPLKKQLWQQTVMAKIQNQAVLLGQRATGDTLFPGPDKLLTNLARDVKSGDAENMEAQAAAYYWKHLFAKNTAATGQGVFYRDRNGPPPNGLLNYGYALLRAVVARGLVGSGLLPTAGIFHRNQYNAYCLADDVMEPYRPFVDKVVCQMVDLHGMDQEVTTDNKKRLLAIPAMDVLIDGQYSPLMNAVQRTTASLARCFEGKVRKMLYPVLT